MFKVGQKVVCVLSGKSVGGHTLVTETIYEVLLFDNETYGEPAIEVVEMPNVVWPSRKFRPLNEQFAESVLQKVAEEINQEQLIEA